MKKDFIRVFCFGLAALMIASCGRSGNEANNINSENYSADTMKVRQLLDSFAYYLDRNELNKLHPFAESAYSLAERISYEDGMADAMTAFRSYYSTIGD